MSRALSSSFSSVLARRAKCTRQSVINMKTRCMRRTNLQNLTTKLAIAVKQRHLMETHTHTHCERQQQLLLLHPFNGLEYGLRLRFLCRCRTELSASEESPQSSQAADKDATSGEQSAKQQPDSEQQNASSSDNTPR